MSDPCSKFERKNDRQFLYLSTFTADMHTSSASHGTWINPVYNKVYKINIDIILQNILQIQYYNLLFIKFKIKNYLYIMMQFFSDTNTSKQTTF